MSGDTFPVITTTGLKVKAKCLNPECRKHIGHFRLEPRDAPANFQADAPTAFYVVPDGMTCPHCGAWNYFTLFGSFYPKTGG